MSWHERMQGRGNVLAGKGLGTGKVGAGRAGSEVLGAIVGKEVMSWQKRVLELAGKGQGPLPDQAGKGLSAGMA